MTREQNFRTTFIPQLTSYSGWITLPEAEIRKLPLSSFPVFALELGKTKYTKFDPTGKAISGEQEFTVTVYYTRPLRDLDDAYHDHSDLLNIVEQFMNDPVYIPPPVISGDTCCIGRSMVTDAKAPVISFGDTRFAVSVTGKYTFTLF